jgi:hypothetical protein
MTQLPKVPTLERKGELIEKGWELRSIVLKGTTANTSDILAPYAQEVLIPFYYLLYNGQIHSGLLISIDNAWECIELIENGWAIINKENAD